MKHQNKNKMKEMDVTMLVICFYYYSETFMQCCGVKQINNYMNVIENPDICHEKRDKPT